MHKNSKITQLSKKFKPHEMYFNRELSWLKFNLRVLEEAQDPTNPLLERLKFCAIFITNLDEFFMIRVAGLKEQIKAGLYKKTPDGMTPEEQIHKIYEFLVPVLQLHTHTLFNEIIPQLEKQKIRIRKVNDLNSEQKKFVYNYLIEKIFPIVTPLAIDPSHPFPKLRNLNLNLIVELYNESNPFEPLISVIPIPSILPPVIHFKNNEEYDFVLLEDIISEYLECFFPGLNITNVSKFKITRNADLDISEAEADDLLKLIEKELRKRNLGTVIRLELTPNISEASKQILLDSLEELREKDIYVKDELIEANTLWEIYRLVDRQDLKDEPFTPVLNLNIVKSENIFEAIKSKDILLWHPYESFNHVVDLIKEAANDPNVLAIKITLYRTSGSKSPIVSALKEAVIRGKNVTALIELKARFDEQKNITWARELESEGANVVYGVMGLKTHCKVCLIVRKEGEEIRNYVHLSTGNYNEITARIYTDISLMTCNSEITKDVSELFNLLTGYSKQQEWRKIFVAPVSMRKKFKELIESCIRYHSAENPSAITIVMNSLVDPEMINLLYCASNKGIPIKLLIRGICCLVPGVKGLSENISVRSIVGRFLEHSRIYLFEFNHTKQIYCGSADWMERNLDRRVEVAFPILDPDNQNQILEILDIFFRGNVKTRFLNSQGEYKKIDLNTNQEKPFNVQNTFIELAELQQKYIDTITQSLKFNELS